MQLIFIAGTIKRRPTKRIDCWGELGYWFTLACPTLDYDLNAPGTTNPDLIKCCVKDRLLTPNVIEYAYPGCQILATGVLKHLPRYEGKSKTPVDYENYLLLDDIEWLSNKEAIGEFNLEGLCNQIGITRFLQKGLSGKGKKKAKKRATAQSKGVKEE